MGSLREPRFLRSMSFCVHPSLLLSRCQWLSSLLLFFNHAGNSFLLPSPLPGRGCCYTVPVLFCVAVFHRPLPCLMHDARIPLPRDEALYTVRRRTKSLTTCGRLVVSLHVSSALGLGGFWLWFLNSFFLNPYLHGEVGGSHHPLMSFVSH